MLTGSPELIRGLREIAGDYDALICDVWGVVHDGAHAYPAAVEALQKFRAGYGRVVLLSNAPRPPDATAGQLKGFGVPDDCYDAIVTSGGATRDDLAARAAKGTLAMMHIGPERDRPIYDGLDVRLTEPNDAEIVLLSGLYDDHTETPENYKPLLAELKARDLVMICANPDILVPIGDKIVYCAGAIARVYEEIGGKVIYYGKPHPPIYAMAFKAAAAKKQVLAVGDALETDIAGANRAGIDALLVTGGLHEGDIGALTAESLAEFFAKHKERAIAAIEKLKW